MPFCSFFFPIEIAKVKPREILYCVTKTAKLKYPRNYVPRYASKMHNEPFSRGRINPGGGGGGTAIYGLYKYVPL